jgi:ribosomal protein S14
MAKLTWILKCAKTPKFSTRKYTRCSMCGYSVNIDTPMS